MAEYAPIARSPIASAAALAVIDGWEISTSASEADLTIVDCTPVAKVVLRAHPSARIANSLGIAFGRAGRDTEGRLIIGSSPGEWMVFGPPGNARSICENMTVLAADEFATIVDATHARALMRVSGVHTVDLLSKLCPINFSDEAAPNGTALRSVAAKVVTDIVRDDLNWGSVRQREQSGISDTELTRSYLLHCERSSGQYLCDCILDAGAEFGAEMAGFTWR